MSSLIKYIVILHTYSFNIIYDLTVICICTSLCCQILVNPLLQTLFCFCDVGNSTLFCFCDVGDSLFCFYDIGDSEIYFVNLIRCFGIVNQNLHFVVNKPCDWLKQITWSDSANRMVCLLQSTSFGLLCRSTLYWI